MDTLTQPVATGTDEQDSASPRRGGRLHRLLGGRPERAAARYLRPPARSSPGSRATSPPWASEAPPSTTWHLRQRP